jgi:hypothetical protein
LAESNLSAADFVDERQKRLFNSIKEQFQSSGKVSVPALCDEAAPEDRDWVLALSLGEMEFEEPQERMFQLVRDIRMKKDRRRLQELKGKLAGGEFEPRLQDEYKDLLRRVKGSSAQADKPNDAKGVATK